MKKSHVVDPRVKRWYLTQEKTRKFSEKITDEGNWKHIVDANIMWEAMVECIHRSFREILGTSRKGGCKMKKHGDGTRRQQRKSERKKRHTLLSLTMEQMKRRRLVELDISPQKR